MTPTGSTLLLGVLGWPVKHSLSPRLHNYWLAQDKMDAAYLPLAVPPAGLTTVIRALPQMGFRGANVTIPHKENLCALVDQLDPLAAQIGAVNTLVIQPDGKIFGTNTDAYGFSENIIQSGHSLAAGTALVLGAGGAARAVLAALVAAHCPKIILTNRSPERAALLAQQFGATITCLPWEQWPTALPQTHTLINTTACGLNGQDDLLVPLETMPQTAAVCDLVYRPLQTGLLRQAAQANLKTIDGLGMLLYQAQASFHHWFGITPVVDEKLRRFMREAL